MFSLSRDNLRFDIFMLRLKRLYIALKKQISNCFLITERLFETKCQKCMYIFNFVYQYSCTHLWEHKRAKRGGLVEIIPKKRVKRGVFEENNIRV